jgi:hypothetical protein
VLLDAPQLGRAGELLPERARPAEAGRDRIGRLGDVVAVQRVAGLEPQRVARAEPARDDAACEHRVPQHTGVFGHAEQLAAVLARIAGAVDHRGHPFDLRLGEGEGRSRRQAELRDRVRPLHGQQAVLVRDVADVGAAHLALLQPGEVDLAIRRVDDEQVAVGAEPVGDQVVDDAAALVREERVLGAAGLDPVEVVREQALEQLVGTRALDLELAHVRDVEDAGVGAHGAMLLDHPLVLDRHLPPGERDESCTESDVAVVKRCREQGLRHAQSRS